MQESRFPPRGLTWFWFLNDVGEPRHIDSQIDAFARAGAGAVCLHPRCGLGVPYGGDAWFAFIRRTVRRCASRGLQVWLYDEDPYPSGNAGGRLVMEHPEFEARRIEMFEAPAGIKSGEPFRFPGGILLWAGIVPCAGQGGGCIDFTAQVGLLRRKWTVLRGWDSRWYYPATPLYKCDRAWTRAPEYVLRAPRLPDGMRLLAFVARPSGANSQWGTLADTLNPAATERFIAMTHERYRQTVGGMFGRDIKAIFTDEPKYFGQKPWTPGMFQDFERRRGYDLRPRLHHLFAKTATPEAIRTRIDYREWCGWRFEQAWLAPVAAWCHRHDLKLVGHISPEDDPVEQANTISNLFPLQKHFDLCGIDLIIPAVGDRRHPLLNLGVVTATSIAQQCGKPGVMSESLGCSGNDFTAAAAIPILNWQTVMGVTTPVIHGAFSSTAGNRRIDAPPDFGPCSRRWDDMVRLTRHLPAIQDIVVGARQVAPVAIIWPIRSFQADATAWQADAGGLRGALAALILKCLEAQVGIHFVDEADLQSARIARKTLFVGKAAYTHLVIPDCLLLHAGTIAAIRKARRRGIRVLRCGGSLRYLQDGRGVRPLAPACLPRALPVDALVAQLPRLIRLGGPHAADVRCTGWVKRGVKWLLFINTGDKRHAVRVGGRSLDLPPGAIVPVRMK